MMWSLTCRKYRSNVVIRWSLEFLSWKVSAHSLVKGMNPKQGFAAMA